jgi:hypothetical protein
MTPLLATWAICATGWAVFFWYWERRWHEMANRGIELLDQKQELLEQFAESSQLAAEGNAKIIDLYRAAYWREWQGRWAHMCTVFAAVAACRQAHEDGAATIPWDHWGAK